MKALDFYKDNMHTKIKESLWQIGMLLLTKCGDYIISKIQGRFWDADMYKTVDYAIKKAGKERDTLRVKWEALGLFFGIKKPLN